ncbi:MAG: SH3 domain-containing protein [Candidatus Aminicenantes bacterium RBG_16_66_30]
MRMKPTVLSLILILAAGAALAEAAQNVPARTTKVKVTAEQANLREKPDIGSSIVQQIPEGTVLDADRKEGEWYFVRYTLEDGGVIGGWIHESLVQVVEQGGPVVEPPKKPEQGTPPSGRGTRPIRIGRIKAPEFRTGSIPLEISVSAGVATLAPRDLNDGTRGYADWYGASTGLAVTEEPSLVHLAGLVGFELSYRFSPQLAFGLGADFFRGANGDRVDLTGSLSETVSTKPSLRGVPFKAMVRFYPGSGFYLRGALGIYSIKAGYLFRHEGAGVWEQWKGSATASGFGGEAAFGGEWDIAARTVFFVEAGLRMARFESLTGRNLYTNSSGEAVLEPGTLFFFHKTAGGDKSYPLFFVRETAPAEEGVVDVRRAKINISGTTVRVGVRYRF